MIDVIINSYNEPKATLRAVQIFLEQYPGDDMNVTVVDPFPEVEEFLRKEIKDERFDFFLDPGEGKSYSLNMIFQEKGSMDKEDIFILTDGDVYVSKDAVREILKAFLDEKVGCVTGRPVSVDKKNNRYGFWSHFLFDGIDEVRRKLSDSGKFFECSGYLFAIRKGVIFDFPMETSEDSIIPHLFWKKGYLIRYLPRAEVYVKNPDTWKDWKNQKVRNILAHENLSKIAPDMERTKSFFNEAKQGFRIFTYPKKLSEFFWAIELAFARLVIYFIAFKKLRKNKEYKDGWREVEIDSTKPLD